MSNIAIQIEDLLVNYSSFKLIIEHLELESGYIYGLIGKNGAGKTTFLKSLVNLTRHINDKVLIYGKSLSDNEIELKNHIGYINDEFMYPLNMTSEKLAKNLGVFYKNFDITYFYDLLAKFKISKFTKFKEMSKGNRHKIMIIFNLAYHPDLLILDEPTANIDPIIRREILDLLKDTMDDNKTVLFSTHITSDLDRIADYVILIEDGKIIFNLAKDQIEEEYQKVYLDEVDNEIKPYLKGLKKNDFGYEALCTNTSKFIHNHNYQFKRANIEEIMYYWEINHE